MRLLRLRRLRSRVTMPYVSWRRHGRFSRRGNRALRLGRRRARHVPQLQRQRFGKRLLVLVGPLNKIYPERLLPVGICASNPSGERATTVNPLPLPRRAMVFRPPLSRREFVDAVAASANANAGTTEAVRLEDRVFAGVTDRDDLREFLGGSLRHFSPRSSWPRRRFFSRPLVATNGAADAMPFRHSRDGVSASAGRAEKH